MCDFGVSNRGEKWVPLEKTHIGERYKISQLVQESQQDAESGARIDSFV